ncbi:ABC transporter permease [Gryllotalpicola ginsengisoli]|uniref:ABC transporter permease n=1 Tax=Gryllotalpicola ginsengisoli TaxID=444608 RepID=UPI0003B3224B|nr:ABC transporter permease [Gryllotalpicola ginsengisoli]
MATDLTRPLSRRWGRAAVAAVLPVAVLVAWQLLSTSGLFTITQLPSPELVWQAALDLGRRGLLGQYVAISTQRVLIGFAAGAALGIVLGAFVGLSRFWAAFFSFTLASIRAVPSLAWVPLLIIWFHIGEAEKVILVAIGAFFPVYTTVAGSLRHVDPHLIEAGRAYGYSGARLFGAVQLPAVLPSVVSGLRLALAQAWLFLVAAELLGASMGLGYLLTQSQQVGRTDQTFLAIFLLAILGSVSDLVVGLVSRVATRRWS